MNLFWSTYSEHVFKEVMCYSVPAGKGTIPDLGGSLSKLVKVTEMTKRDTGGVVVASVVICMTVEVGSLAWTSVHSVRVENTFSGIV